MLDAVDAALWVLIPVRELLAGKSRLAPVLSNSERRDLNEFFLRRTLGTAAEAFGTKRIAVISDGDDALTLAQQLNAEALRQTHGDLNHAVYLGSKALYKIGAIRILIIPVDLPFVRAHDLIEVVALGKDGSIVICPDSTFQGTNAIFLPQPCDMHFRFGSESCQQHQILAKACGLPSLIHFNERIAHDIDLPADLAGLTAFRDQSVSRDGADHCRN